jgi:hypothetical protein
MKTTCRQTLGDANLHTGFDHVSAGGTFGAEGKSGAYGECQDPRHDRNFIQSFQLPAAPLKGYESELSGLHHSISLYPATLFWEGHQPKAIQIEEEFKSASVVRENKENHKCDARVDRSLLTRRVFIPPKVRELTPQKAVDYGPSFMLPCVVLDDTPPGGRGGAWANTDSCDCFAPR